MKEVSIFKRGQVWYINDNRRNVGSIQGRSRPYLVVSNDKCNANSPVIHMAPITTQEKNNQPTHVTFYSPQTRSIQTVLAEQTMPKSVPDITPIAEYRYTLSEEKMTEVDKALAVQFGIPYGGVSMDDFEELLDMIKEKKLAEIRAEAQKLTSDRVNAYTDRLLEAVDQIQVTAPSPEPEVVKKEEKLEQPTIEETPKNYAPKAPQHRPVHMSQVDKFNARMQKSNALQGKSTAPVSTPTPTEEPDAPKRNRWTIERKRQFVADAENPNLTKKQVMDKYGMASTTYATTLSRFRRELKQESTNEEVAKGDSEAEKFLADYDSKPISEVMKLYQLPDKKAAVERAAFYRAQLGR